MIFKCLICPDQDKRWEQDLPADRGQKALDAHQQAHHGVLPPAPDPDHVPQPVQQLAHVDWWTHAIDGIAQLARESLRTGEPFTVYEVTKYGVGEPSNPRTDWGKVTRDAEHQQLIIHATDGEGRHLAGPSKRPGVNGSLVSLWRPGPAVTGKRPSRSDTA